MINQLIELTNKIPPKQLPRSIKKDSDLYNFVQSFYGSSINEKVYNALHPNENICPNGNFKNFTSLTHGYRNCGIAKHCICTKNAVSESVIDTCSTRTHEQQILINEKRGKTNLERYGVENIGQSENAITNHKLLYSDPNKVEEISKKVAKTKLEKWGDSNYNNIDKIKESLKEKYTIEYWSERCPEKSMDILLDQDKLTILYHQHPIEDIANILNVHVQTVYRYLNQYNLREPYKSEPENEIVQFLNQNGITNIVRNSRKILLSKKELDIFLPDYNIAIEYNGIYWHHEDIEHITRTYHSDKFYQCERQGIQLITIFSNFWKSKKDIVKQSLLNKLNLQHDKIYARNCTISEVSTHDTKLFLNKYHIQGYTPSSIRLGLYYDNNLVALMTFSNTRIGIGKREQGHELVRFASCSRIIGGASKLLKHFIKLYNPEKIISYSDNEWSNGQLYNTIGFTLESEIKPSYWYIKHREEKFLHRYNFAKHKLIKMGHDPLKSEREITKEIGLLKLWDCGKRRWVWYNNLTKNPPKRV